jgi:hypothetical protein
VCAAGVIVLRRKPASKLWPHTKHRHQIGGNTQTIGRLGWASSCEIGEVVAVEGQILQDRHGRFPIDGIAQRRTPVRLVPRLRPPADNLDEPAGSLYGRGASSTVPTMLKMAMLTPNPAARISTAVALKAGVLRICRLVCRRSPRSDLNDKMRANS